MRVPSHHNCGRDVQRFIPAALFSYSPFTDMVVLQLDDRHDMIRGGARHPGRRSRATALYSVDPCADRNHDAVIRIIGEAPGRRAHSAQRRFEAMVLKRGTATSDLSADP
jgi:hypothetical protein